VISAANERGNRSYGLGFLIYTYRRAEYFLLRLKSSGIRWLHRYRATHLRAGTYTLHHTARISLPTKFSSRAQVINKLPRINSQLRYSLQALASLRNRTNARLMHFPSDNIARLSLLHSQGLFNSPIIDACQACARLPAIIKYVISLPIAASLISFNSMFALSENRLLNLI
jgi:hypothetical protein